MTPTTPRDHGGGLDAAILRYGGTRHEWIDLSTGINPVPYPIPPLPADAWSALPDLGATARLTDVARAFWKVPMGAAILAAPGASALVARLPLLAPPARVAIRGPTYNEHAAAFRFHGWEVVGDDKTASARVTVHPNNPDGRLSSGDATRPFEIIDESFCDICPDYTRIAEATIPGTVVLKSFGKFWGLAGARLGFAIALPDTIARLAEHLGPWPVSGPALAIGTVALGDTGWASATRARLARDAARLDALLIGAGATVVGGTDLFRLFADPNGGALHDRLARAHIWSRRFPYAAEWLRLGMPPVDGWARLEQALA